MAAWLIAVIGVVYAIVAFDLIRHGNVGLVLLLLAIAWAMSDST